ncbi:MAG: DUF2480 family protein [Bacteroidetes bacterium]|nr:DUF2480 family protein [Bacteroidota bacterium]
MEEIINKVKDSGLINLDLEKFTPNSNVDCIDIADLLWNGLVLKEKDFRAWVKDHDWSKYQNTIVQVTCTADAIVPTWAYMIIGAQLNTYADTWVVGSKEALLKKSVTQKINQLDLVKFQDGLVIIKGCSNHPYSDFAMASLVEKLQPVVKSIMYGEPCSTVPIYKRPRI